MDPFYFTWNWALAGIIRDFSQGYQQVFLMILFLSVILFILTLVMNQRKVETKVLQ